MYKYHNPRELEKKKSVGNNKLEAEIQDVLVAFRLAPTARVEANSRGTGSEPATRSEVSSRGQTKCCQFYILTLLFSKNF